MITHLINQVKSDINKIYYTVPIIPLPIISILSCCINYDTNKLVLRGNEYSICKDYVTLLKSYSDNVMFDADISADDSIYINTTKSSHLLV